MRDIKRIRNDFLERFGKLARDERMKVLNQWFPPAFPEDTVVANWICEDLKKVMRVQESDYDDEKSQFGGFVGKAGLDYEYDDFCIIAFAANEKVREIFELYKLWFLEDISPPEMRKILASSIQRLNPEMDEILVSYVQRLNKGEE